MGYFQEIYQAEIPHRCVTVYMYLKDRTGRKGTCWPAIGTIARDLGLSRSTVKRALKDLEEKGLRFDPTTTEWDENGKKIVYLDHELAGFALHLVRKELK